MHNYEKNNERKIVQLLSQGNTDAFVQVFNQYHDRIYRVAMQYVKSQALSEEIVQDVFMKLWEKREALSQVLNFEAWFITLSKNYILNYLKRMANERNIREKWISEVPQTEEKTDHHIRHAEYTQLMEQALDNLSEQQRMVYTLAREQKLSYEAIGKELSLSPNTVKTHMSRALQSIRAFFKQQDLI